MRNFASDVPIFHGARSQFQQFHDRKAGSGEGAGVKIGYHFTGTLAGAAHHAEHYVRSDHKPVVYVCRLKSQANILCRGERITNHAEEIQQMWQQMPLVYSTLNDSNDWYELLLSQNFSDKSVIEDEDVYKLRLLSQHGFDGVDDFEGWLTDGHFGSATLLVLNPDVIEIVEVMDVESHWNEIVQRKTYKLGTEPTLFSWKTGYCSYLHADV